MRNVYLHGRLSRFAEVVELEVDTAGEAIRGLCCNFKGLGDELKIGSYVIMRGDAEKGLSLDVDDLNTFKLGVGDLHIIPHTEGSKRGGGVMKIILGVALIGAAIFFAPAAATFGASMTAGIAGGAIGGLTYGNLAMIGVAVTLAGVSTMLTNPTKEGDENKDQSYSISGPGNTYEQGNPVPLVYGEVITGGVLISAGMDIEQIGSYK